MDRTTHHHLPEFHPLTLAPKAAEAAAAALHAEVRAQVAAEGWTPLGPVTLVRTPAWEDPEQIGVYLPEEEAAARGLTASPATHERWAAQVDVIRPTVGPPLEGQG